jgi:hypothetical protein
MRSRAAVVIAFALIACAAQQPRKEQVVSEGVVLPTAMCSKPGTVAMSNDAPGKRMVCELQEPVGSHLPKCVCWDEQQMAQNREDAQEMIREQTAHKNTNPGN